MIKRIASLVPMNLTWMIYHEHKEMNQVSGNEISGNIKSMKPIINTDIAWRKLVAFQV